ncbi:MAG: hypothetical protein KIS96_06195 [Bauldia sp.]|nr:hypothetical protein [Bauldia sp.]
MRENRRHVLDLLGDGKISAEEADKLIEALGADTAVGTIGAGSKAWPKYLRVLVEAEENGDGELTKVNIRVPMQLLRAGVRLASLIPPMVHDQVNQAMREQGVGFDLAQLRPENLEELVENLKDLTIDVDHPKNKVKVRVFCE